MSIHKSCEQKSFARNLSDDQKLVISSERLKNQEEIKLAHKNVDHIPLIDPASQDHCDSGNDSDVEIVHLLPPALPAKQIKIDHGNNLSVILPSQSDLLSPNLITSLLIDIRNHPVNYNQNPNTDKPQLLNDQMSVTDIKLFSEIKNDTTKIDFFSNDHKDEYIFHINEHISNSMGECRLTHDESDESFAGFKDLKSGTSTIRSNKGTIRGVKNRVRNGIVTFLQMQQTTVKVRS